MFETDIQAPHVVTGGERRFTGWASAPVIVRARAGRLLRRGWLVRVRLRWWLRREKRLAPAWPAVCMRCMGIALCLLALVVIADAAGRRPASITVLGKGALVSTIAEPAVAIVLGAVFILIIGAFWRRIRFEYLVRVPGPILVRDLAVPSTAAPDDGTQPSAASTPVGLDVAQLSSDFRQRLQQLRLQAPTPVPGAVAPQDYLDLLDSEHLDTKNPLASLVGVLRAATPTHAYEVSPRLVLESDQSGRYRVSAQVTRLPREVVPVATASGSTVEEAIRQAADIVTAAILPRTTLSNRPPWSGWRHYPMPPLLVYHFERSQELSSQRRYDEALAHCFAALEGDPKSVDLRLHMGYLQEKLGLFLDALGSYLAARNIAKETEKAWELYTFGARRKRRASGQTASYRLAILLAGEKAALQWLEAEEWLYAAYQTRRREELQRLRDRLRPELKRLVKDQGLLAKGAAPADESPKTRWTRSEIEYLLQDKRAKAGSPEFYALRDVFAALARKILKPMSGELRRPFSARTWLSPLAVELTIKTVDLRHQYVQKHLTGDNVEWPPTAKSLEAQLPRSGLFSTWTERYNAACLLALPLLTPDKELPKNHPARTELAKLAVAQLEHAMARATSVYVASRRDWVLSEDPDLRGLRRTLEFKRFEARYFPSASRTLERSENVHMWELLAYANMLVAATAQWWRRVWERQSVGSPRGMEIAISELYADDLAAWRLVRLLSCEYGHWRTRQQAIEKMAAWSAKYGSTAFAVSIPKFEENFTDDPGAAYGRRADSRQRVKQEIDRGLTRLSDVHSELHQLDLGQLANSNGDAAEPGKARAELWRALQAWIVHTPHGDCDSCREEFTAAATRAASQSP